MAGNTAGVGMRIKWLIIAGIITTLLLWAFYDRRVLLMALIQLQSDGAPPALNDAPQEGGATEWIDDYFTIELLAPNTYAIGEPRYHQSNYNYLIVGTQRAVLFDAGPGVRNIEPVVDSLTDLPITFVPSHFHYDHIGANLDFEHIAVVNLPYIRKRAPDNQLALTDSEHLGGSEGFTPPTWKVSEWLDVGATLDLGGRALSVLHTPGHTTDSISLWDAERNILFAGDYLYPGHLYAFLPNSNMGDYLQTAESLVSIVTQEVSIYGAHRAAPPGAPRLSFNDLRDLRGGLVRIREGSLRGEGLYPKVFVVNERLGVLAEPRWLQDWDR
ncbi:MAG: MBL fold metallo-hydrolase [Candidatus Tectomicrobia bacterium]